jgi:predicted transcriptional regulator
MEDEIFQATATIVAALVSADHITIAEVRETIGMVWDALTNRNADKKDSGPSVPVVPPEKSVFKKSIICLKCGKELKVLKRHIRSEHKLTPDQYRAEFCLPPEYPMTSPDYSEHRSNMAKEHGLGRKSGKKPKPVSNGRRVWATA